MTTPHDPDAPRATDPDDAPVPPTVPAVPTPDLPTPWAEAGPELTHDSDSDSGTDTDSGTDGDTETDTDDVPLAEPEWFADATPEVGWHAEPDAEPEPTYEPEPAHDDELDADAEPTYVPEPQQVEAETEPETEPESWHDEVDAGEEPDLAAETDELLAELPADEGELPADVDLVDAEPEELEAQPALDDAGPAAVRRSRAVPVLAALAAVLVVAVAVLAVFAQRAEGLSETEQSRRAALDASRTAARAIFSYDYRQLDKDFAAGKAVTTGKFREQYENSTAKVVREVAPKYKAVVVADVGETAVVTAGEDRVKVLVFLDQQSTSTLTAQPKITQSRLEMTLVRSGSAWLVSEIRAF